MVKGADDLSLRFASFANSRKVRQIRENPEVHLTCGVTDASAMTPYLQIQGRANFTQDAHERHAFWNDMLDNLFEGADDPLYGVVVVRPYRIEYCTPGGFEPEVWDASRETAPG
jgi:general stress protein 26